MMLDRYEKNERYRLLRRIGTDAFEGLTSLQSEQMLQFVLERVNSLKSLVSVAEESNKDKYKAELVSEKKLLDLVNQYLSTRNNQYHHSNQGNKPLAPVEKQEHYQRLLKYQQDALEGLTRMQVRQLRDFVQDRVQGGIEALHKVIAANPKEADTLSSPSLERDQRALRWIDNYLNAKDEAKPAKHKRQDETKQSPQNDQSNENTREGFALTLIQAAYFLSYTLEDERLSIKEIEQNHIHRFRNPTNGKKQTSAQALYQKHNLINSRKKRERYINSLTERQKPHHIRHIETVQEFLSDKAQIQAAQEDIDKIMTT
jgi:hypothetical protein